MPLFRRWDGDPVKGLSTLRRMMPYVLKTRNESVVYHEQIVDLSRTLPFVEAWNATHTPRISVFHVVLAAFGRVLAARPGLNRFVSGGRIYQRRDVTLSFAAKQRFSDDSPIRTVKVAMPEGEAFEATVARLHAAVGEGRSDVERPVDKEVRLALILPGFLLRAALGLLRTLDRWNLMPAAMARGDPMFASLFAANLGSVGIDRVWHHLFEYGTVSLFAVVGEATKRVVPGPDGTPVVRDTLSVRYTFDERINDGFYCASSLGLVRELVEDPERLLP